MLSISTAGKTETTKKAMQFFAQLAGGTGVEDQVLEVRTVQAAVEQANKQAGRIVHSKSSVGSWAIVAE